MSAAEKLKALDGALPVHPMDDDWLMPPDETTEALADLRNALPQIVAVVEVAETLVGNQRHPRVSVSNVSPGSSERARIALAALDEALS